ncbi:MAG: chromosomal replication initiator protein DnaA [Acidobacteria bacterium]|nr:chromosomal replication initiator protein DnaA [Acidobacteriota bacterium]
MNPWQQIVRSLQPEISPQSFENWLEPVRFSHVDDDRSLHLIAPNSSAKRWIEDEFLGKILAASQLLALDITSLSFDVVEPSMAPQPHSSAVQTAFNFSTPASSFSSKYTFDTFVVGSCNELAHAAARAVATNPARAYNPLYIYGGVGMGKTHLMHAIGQELQQNFPELQVVYVSSEEFMNEMISSLRYDRMGSFHRRFRAADVLLVDDIQTLGSKERTQEEFFHTFNTLHNLQKQLVISSDRPPKQIPGLVDRLRSRFEWGLMADIQAPDLETKMAILAGKAEKLNLDLDHEIQIFLATNLKSNIRELEGALTHLMAISSLSGSKITLSMARQTLHSVTELKSKSQTTIEQVVKVVAQDYGLEPAQLKQKTNVKSISYPRQIVMYLAKDVLGMSLPEIGKALGGKHHTTVLHAVRKIEAQRQGSQEIDNLLHRLTDRIS